MAIDDPIAATEQQLASEARQDPPLSEYAAGLALVAGGLPEQCFPHDLAATIAAVKAALTFCGHLILTKKEERRRLLAEVLRDEFVRVRDKLERLDAAFYAFVKDEFYDLVLDALQKAERTRARGRIQRMARILATGLISQPVRSSDLTEELTRIAMHLDDQDVSVLAALVRGQRPKFNPALGRVDEASANKFWTSGDPDNPNSTPGGIAQTLSISEGELESVCAKLQSFGLVSQVQRSPIGKLSTVPYGVLRRGIDFVDSCSKWGADEVTG